MPAVFSFLVAHPVSLALFLLEGFVMGIPQKTQMHTLLAKIVERKWAVISLWSRSRAQGFYKRKGGDGSVPFRLDFPVSEK